MPALTRAEERRVRRLAGGRRRASEGLFIAEGVRVVEEILAAGVSLRMAIIAPALEGSERGAALARRLETCTTLRAVEDRELRDLAATRSPQGVLVVAEEPRADLDSIGAAGAEGGDAVLVLDGVQDPGNVGALARSAAAFGCAGLVCLPGTVDPWSPKAVRASAGGLFRMPVVRPPPDALWAWLRAEGVTLVGADASGTAPRELARPGRLALAVGNEGAGLSPAVRARCGELVAIPMRGGAESLNVAVAAAILLYEITRGSE